jgi:hypothetical protein
MRHGHDSRYCPVGDPIPLDPSRYSRLPPGTICAVRNNRPGTGSPEPSSRTESALQPKTCAGRGRYGQSCVHGADRLILPSDGSDNHIRPPQPGLRDPFQSYRQQMRPTQLQYRPGTIQFSSVSTSAPGRGHRGTATLLAVNLRPANDAIASVSRRPASVSSVFLFSTPANARHPRFVHQQFVRARCVQSPIAPEKA